MSLVPVLWFEIRGLRVGHFLLVRGLVEVMGMSKDARIVLLGSEAHRKYSAKDMLFTSLENINVQRSYLQRYGNPCISVERVD